MYRVAYYFNFFEKKYFLGFLPVFCFLPVNRSEWPSFWDMECENFFFHISVSIGIHLFVPSFWIFLKLFCGSIFEKKFAKSLQHVGEFLHSVREEMRLLVNGFYGFYYQWVINLLLKIFAKFLAMRWGAKTVFLIQSSQYVLLETCLAHIFGPKTMWFGF